MKKWIRRMFLLVCFVLAHCTWIYFNLDIGESARVSDVIIVPEGGSERSQYAGALLREGFSTSGYVIVSPYIGVDGDLRYSYQLAGVPQEQIIQENQATSTWTNAVNTLALMDEYGYHSALVVTSDYHTRRTRMIYERVNQNYDFELTYVSAYPIIDGETKTYRESTYNHEAALRELYKYYGYVIGLYHYIDL